MNNPLRRIKRLANNRGSILLISYLVIALLVGFGAAFLMLSFHESRVAERQQRLVKALYIAEAGIERALYDLKLDFVNDNTSPSWSDTDINGMAIGPDTVNFYAVPYASTSMNGGSYTVEFKNVGGSGESIWVKSTGTLGDVTRTIQVYLVVRDISPWTNAIFGGAGAAGGMVNGNVDIRGSVHILGEGLTSSDFAIDLGGTAELVGNNYTGLDSALAAKVPPLPTTVFNGEVVSTLNSELRVKRGIVGLSGSATVGEANVAGNSTKETVDGSYVTDGFGGSQGTTNVHSDNGWSNSYDLGDELSFPSLSDPHPSNPLQTVQQFFQSGALVLTTELSTISSSSSFDYTDGTNSISMDGAGNLTVTGQVYVDGDNNVLFTGGKNNPITYSGAGTLLVTGNVAINTTVVTSGSNSFPTNILGIMTPKDISFDSAGIDAMGVFYAENQITAAKQTDIMGTFVSNLFNMGTNVPSIFQVPDVADHLPPGMINPDPVWLLKTVSWQEI
jgi:hypothetical protein